MTRSSWVPPLTCNLAIYLVLIKMASLPLYFTWEIKFLLFCIKSWSVSPKLTSAIGYLSRCQLTANLTWKVGGKMKRKPGSEATDNSYCLIRTKFPFYRKKELQR